MVLLSRSLVVTLLGLTALSACSESTATLDASQSDNHAAWFERIEESRGTGPDSSDREGRSALQADDNPTEVDLAEPGHVAPGEDLTDDGEAPMEDWPEIINDVDADAPQNGGDPSAIDLAEPGYVAPGEDLSDDGEAPMENWPEIINDVDPVEDKEA